VQLARDHKNKAATQIARHGKGNRQMTKRRWMKTVLDAASEEQIEMPWARAKRAAARSAKTIALEAAE